MLTEDNWVLQTIKGFQIPFVGQPVQERKPRVPSFPSEQLVQMQEEISSLLEKRGSNNSGQSLASDRVLLSSVSGPHEEWGNEASNQPQNPQPVGRHPSFQNGGPTHPKRPAKAGRLAGKGRPERCLPYSAHPSRPSMLPPVQHRRSELPVHLLPFGLACAPWAFTKVMKAIVTLLRSWGTKIIIYIDDILIMEESAVL